MNYRNKSFSVTVGGQAFGEGWERTFGTGAQAETPAPPAAPPSSAPFSPYTLRCGSCGHATNVTRPEDLAAHRAHNCSGKKTIVVDSSSDLAEAMSAGWRALFPAAALQGALQATIYP